MPSALYRPLETDLKDANCCYAQNQKPTLTPRSNRLTGGGGGGGVNQLNICKGSNLRRIVFLILVCLLFVFVWCSLATYTTTDEDVGGLSADGESRSFTDNLNISKEQLVICGESQLDERVYIQNRARDDYNNLPIIYFVTPTYPRREQIPELTRLSHTLLNVPRLHWIVANDYNVCNVYIDYLLNKFGIPFTHLASPMPSAYRKAPVPRGVANRRAALKWLRHNNITNGILYFGDDDNTYDLKLFKEIRDTQVVSMFPVGLIASYSFSGPVVREGKVIGFLDSWTANRHWPVDMAGFAVNIAYMAKHPKVNMPYKAGYEEDYFLRSLALRMDQIEPKGNNCTEILVWHTQTKTTVPSTLRINNKYLDDRSNLGALFKSLETMGVVRAQDNEGIALKISKNGKEQSLNLFLS